jgi:pSer/pThr/pTyr-binding forkhead associated (FHA) protein
MYCIEAMNGPLDGKQWPFERDIVIGRDDRVAGAALPTDRAVSRRHAVVTLESGELTIADLSSSNGTVVGGESIAAPVKIEVGQPFRIGRTLLRVVTAKGDE